MAFPGSDPSPVLSLRRIEATFDAKSSNIFTPSQLIELIRHHQSLWPIVPEADAPPGVLIANDTAIRAESPTDEPFFTPLLKHSRLKRVPLAFPHRRLSRYTWGEVATFDLIQSADLSGYFTHFTAIHLHGLTEQIPKTIYFNVEQESTGGGGELTQEGIDRTFKGKCRVTRNVIMLRGLRVYKLSGKNTGHLGVIDWKESQDSKPIRITDIERTLIDATVRPVYSGGIFEVAKAYKLAAPRLSLDKLVAYLHRLEYVYPYHQSVGFYLERTGHFASSELEPLRQFPMDYDFYLDYGIRDPSYSQEWRLFIPKRF